MVYCTGEGSTKSYWLHSSATRPGQASPFCFLTTCLNLKSIEYQVHVRENVDDDISVYQYKIFVFLAESVRGEKEVWKLIWLDYSNNKWVSRAGRALKSSRFKSWKIFLDRLPVPDPGKGVCADPVNRGAILEGGGSGPLGRNKEHQLSPDKGRGKTWQDEKMARGQGRLPLHGFKMRACTE